MDIIMKFCRRHDVNIMINYQPAEMCYGIWMTKNHRTIHHLISDQELEMVKDKNEVLLYHLECMFKKLKEDKSKDVGTD